MTSKAITRIAAIAATIGIAGIPLILSTPANAINKPDPGGTGLAVPTSAPANSSNEPDLTQLAAGAIGGTAVTATAFTATARRRRNTQLRDLGRHQVPPVSVHG